MKKLIFVSLLMLGQMAFGQAFINDTAFRSDGRPAAGAQIRVCTTTDTGISSSPTTSQPKCPDASLATIWADKDLTVSKENPFFADSQGNYSYGIAPGFYKEQIIVGNTILTIIRQAPTSTSTGGGGGTGDIASTPTATQVITQPPATSFNVNRINNVVNVTPDYNWTQNPPDDLTSAGSKTITLTPCPKGVSGTNQNHYVYIAGTGTSEAPKITGGTCTSGSSSGTITVITSNTHPTGWTVGSATGGWKEASEYAKFTVSNPSGTSQGGTVMGLPGTEYKFFGPFYISSSGQTVDFNGSIFECNMTSGPCIKAGDDVNQNAFINISILNARGRAMVTSTGTMIETNAQKTRIINPATRAAFSGASFASLITVDDDEANLIDGLNTNLGTWAGTCSSSSCATAVIYKPSAVGYLKNSNLSLGCQANGIDNQGSNTLRVSDTVVQAYPQFGIRSTGGFTTTPNLIGTNVYQEVGSCVNPRGTGTAGLILKGGKNSYDGVGPAGKNPTFTASSPGSTVFNYWVVGTHSTLGSSNSFFAGPCSSSGSGTCTVKWEQFGDSGTTFAVIRQQGNQVTLPAPYTTNCGGGSVSACGSVATAVTTSACTGGVCSFTDDITANTASYSVPSVTYYPKLDAWPGGVILTVGSDGNNFNNSNTRLFVNTTLGLNSFPAISVNQNPSIFAQQCSGTNNGSPIWISCQNSDSSLAALTSLVIPSKVFGAGEAGTQGAITLGTMIAQPGSFARDLVTLIDDKPDKTFSTQGLRPLSDVTDSAICTDQTTAQGPANSQLCIRTPVSYSVYINSAADGTNWKTQLTSTALKLKVPVDFQSGIAYLFSGSEQSAPSSPAAGIQRAYFKAGVGLCAKDSGGTEYCPGTGAVSSVFGRTGAVVAATNDYSEAQISFTDITTNNASATKHGYAPKGTGSNTDCLVGDYTFVPCPGATGGITSINSETGATQTITNGTDDANFIIRWTHAGGTQTSTVSFTGTALAKARQHAATVYNDAANTFSSGLQDFSAVTMKIPHTAGAAPATTGLFQIDDTSNTLEVGINGINKTVALTDSSITGNAATATALAANGANCPSGQFPKGVDASGAAEGCAALLDSDIPDTITASNYVLKAGDTMSGQLILSNLGEEFTESDTNPTCATGNFNIYADASELKLKKCQNGTISDLDTNTGGGGGVGGSSNTQVIFNDGGVPNGDPGMVYDKSVGKLTVTSIQTTGTGPDDFTEIAAPTSPAVGHLSVYGNSTTHRLNDKNASGIVGTSVVPDTGAPSNFLTGIGTDGIPTKAQPSFADISGTISDAQVPDTITVNLATNATQLASNPSNCPANQFPKGIDATGAAEGCAALTDSDIPDTITASNYVLKAGDTMTGQLVTSNLGIKFTDSDTNPSCSAGVYSIFADTSETKLKKCTNGVATDLDTTAAPGAAYTTVAEEGSGLTQRNTLNFIGNAITAADNSGATRTDVTLSQSPSGSTSVVGTGRTLTAGAGLATIGDLSADRTISLDLSTLVNSQTIFDSSAASRTITFGLSGATDPVFTFGNNSFDVSTGVLKQAGVAVATLSDSQSLTNKTLDNTTALTIKDTNFTVQDDADTTKQFKFQASAITTSTTRTFTVPDATTTLVGIDTTQTLTNKTLTTPVISSISNTGTLTLPTSSDTLVGRATTDTLTNKTLTSPVISTITNTGTVTLFTATDTVVGKATTDTLTNKTINVESTGNVFTQPTPIWLPAAGCSNTTAGTFWDLPTSTPAVATCVTGTNIQKGVLAYADTTGGFSAQTTIALPADWTSGTLPDVDIYWTTTATTGNAKWTVAFVCTDVAASATDDPAFPTSSNGFNTVTTAAPGTGSRVQTSTITGATLPSSCVTATKELLHIKLFRDGNDGSDTIAASANFIGMMLTPRRAE